MDKGTQETVGTAGSRSGYGCQAPGDVQNSPGAAADLQTTEVNSPRGTIESKRNGSLECLQTVVAKTSISLMVYHRDYNRGPQYGAC